eukprot:scaffold269927_cov21-Tisochrysis_lutea.AAC.1
MPHHHAIVILIVLCGHEPAFNCNWHAYHRALSRRSRHDQMMSAFGGKGLRAASVPELQAAVTTAIHSALQDKVATAIHPAIAAASHSTLQDKNKERVSGLAKLASPHCLHRWIKHTTVSCVRGSLVSSFPLYAARSCSQAKAWSLAGLRALRYDPIARTTPCVPALIDVILDPMAGVESGNVHSFNAPKAKL